MTDIHLRGLCLGKDVGMSVSGTMTKRAVGGRSLRRFKAEIVDLCRQPGRNVSSVSKEFDLAETAVRR